LTLPPMSYGGSAILNLVALAVVLRIDYENRSLMRRSRDAACALIMVGGTGIIFSRALPSLSVSYANAWLERGALAGGPDPHRPPCAAWKSQLVPPVCV
jgi:hypothetical protein